MLLVTCSTTTTTVVLYCRGSAFLPCIRCPGHHHLMMISINIQSYTGSEIRLPRYVLTAVTASLLLAASGLAPCPCELTAAGPSSMVDCLEALQQCSLIGLEDSPQLLRRSMLSSVSLPLPLLCVPTAAYSLQHAACPNSSETAQHNILPMISSCCRPTRLLPTVQCPSSLTSPQQAVLRQ